MIKVGDSLPEATLMVKTDSGMAPVALADKVKGRKVVLVAVPAAFSGLCDQLHLPSFIRTKPQFEEKGVDEIICVAVNDPFVMEAWGISTGATDAGITLLSDADGSFAKSIGMNFDAPVAGLYGRSLRYAMLAEDGVVKILNMETEHGVCDLTAGETLLDAI